MCAWLMRLVPALVFVLASNSHSKRARACSLETGHFIPFCVSSISARKGFWEGSLWTVSSIHSLQADYEKYRIWGLIPSWANQSVAAVSG